MYKRLRVNLFATGTPYKKEWIGKDKKNYFLCVFVYSHFKDARE